VASKGKSEGQEKRPAAGHAREGGTGIVAFRRRPRRPSAASRIQCDTRCQKHPTPQTPAATTPTATPPAATASAATTSGPSANPATPLVGRRKYRLSTSRITLIHGRPDQRQGAGHRRRRDMTGLAFAGPTKIFRSPAGFMACRGAVDLGIIGSALGQLFPDQSRANFTRPAKLNAGTLLLAGMGEPGRFAEDGRAVHLFQTSS